MRRLSIVLLLVAAGIAALAAKAWLDLSTFRRTPFGSPEEKTIEIPAGASARHVLRLLARGGALSDERLAWRYVRLLARDPRPFRAGEYAFAGRLLPDEVLERVRRGDVKTYQVTIPEGLRMEDAAAAVDAAGLGKAPELLALMRDAAVARELGVPGPNLEGFLFPDTYTFTRNPAARAVVVAMVGRFKEEWRKADAQRAPGVTLDERAAVTLASIVEKETGRPEERARIACVFHNRLRRGMLLQTDPTVMYATLLRTGRWSQNITKRDLLTPHPYNTYTTAGLPPGPIASPGAAALQAALHPAACNDLYFVSRNDGTHVFCPDLACHAAAVRRWQVEYFRHARKSGAGAATPSGSGAAAAARPAP